MTLRDVVGLWVTKRPGLRVLVCKQEFELKNSLLNINVDQDLMHNQEFILEDGRSLRMSYDYTNISMRQAPVGVVATLTRLGDDGLASEIQSYYVGMRQKPGSCPASIDIDENVLVVTKSTLQYRDKTITSNKESIISIPKLEIVSAA